jgi:hypothetical protein
MPDTCSSPAPSAIEAHSGRETIVALCVLASLAVIAIGMAMVQSRFNPAVINFLQGTADRAKGLPAAPATEPIIQIPEGMPPLTPPERFDRETLSDKIDGKAELYLSAGFARLECQRLALAGQPDLWVEVFIYDMGSFENAYAVFSAQRRADATMLDFAEFAYRAENALFFVHGPTYVEMIASGTDDRLRTSMDALARAFILGRPVARATIAERDLFPKNGLVATSIGLISADAFGVAELDRVFTATYAIAGAEMTAFLSRRADPQAAAGLAGAYVDFLKAYGGEVQASGDPLPGAAVVAILDMYEVVFAEGSFLAGVHEAPDRDKAVALAKELAAKLKEVSGAR